MKRVLDIRNENGSSSWRWLAAIMAVFAVITAALVLIPKPDAPALVPMVSRGKVPPAPPAAAVEVPAGPTAASGPAAQVMAAADEPRDKMEAAAPQSTSEDPEAAAADIASEAPQPNPPAGAAAVQPAIAPAVQPTAPSAGGMTSRNVSDRETPLPVPDTARPIGNAAPEEKTAAAGPLPQPEAFTIQVGAYRNKAYADEMFGRLQQGGYAPFIFEYTVGPSKPLYMVRFGRFTNRKEAGREAAGFTQKESMAAVVRRCGSL